ncbi:MAG: DUF2283 domain-containing protein [SAR202 cluster bacterium]|nr:DUF2283 domain-containing protein [SAR202 cluster bacterium]
MVVMRYKYDPQADCAYILVKDLPHAYSKELDETRIVDYAKDGTVIGVELLYISAGVDVSDLPLQPQITKLLQKNKVKIFA